mmetsp:Transcript_61007/g.137634  ORF Transcript_61007/g.137634 Transcript_61007/m.137634 type:complete len:281 (+) Transcript_61007:84-926(+)
MDAEVDYSKPWFEYHEEGKYYFCKLCKAHATKNHVQSAKHVRRAGWKEEEATVEYQQTFSEEFFEWRVDRWFCLLCKQWAVGNHIKGKKHEAKLRQRKDAEEFARECRDGRLKNFNKACTLQPQQLEGVIEAAVQLKVRDRDLEEPMRPSKQARLEQSKGYKLLQRWGWKGGAVSSDGHGIQRPLRAEWRDPTDRTCLGRTPWSARVKKKPGEVGDASSVEADAEKSDASEDGDAPAAEKESQASEAGTPTVLDSDSEIARDPLSEFSELEENPLANSTV